MNTSCARRMNLTEANMSGIIFSSSFGFLPGNDGTKNREALQKMFDVGGHIVVDEKGTYDVCGTAFIGGNTTLEFAAGTHVRRVAEAGGDNAVIMNKGALTRTYDENIVIRGMDLICNGVDITRQDIVGTNAHICFFYTKHTVIENFTCRDLGSHGFCIQICTFEDSRVENVHIEGLKDAVHYGPGRRFILRNGVFRTFDDPIALNANDYAVSNPQMGWIEDGLIEFCFDLDQPQTTGFFCRLLAGSWSDWREGMTIRNSDTVVSDGRMYRAKMPADGREYVSTTRPTHKSGAAVLDGIMWVMTQDDNVVHDCGCRNVHFKDIFLQKNRPTAFAFHFDNDVYSHSYYPYSKAPVQDNITFENVIVAADVKYFMRATTPVGTVKILNSSLKNSSVRLADRGVPGINYPCADMTLSGCTIKGSVSVSAVEGRKLRLHECSNDIGDGDSLEVFGDVDVIK